MDWELQTFTHKNEGDKNVPLLSATSVPSKGKKTGSIKSHKRGKIRKRREKKRKSKKSKSLEWKDLKYIFVKEHFWNKYNCLRVVALLLTLIFLIICLLYGVGSIYILELENFWCPKYSLEEIIENSKSKGLSKGEGGCYVSKLRGADEKKLFAKGDNLNAFQATQFVNFWALTQFILFFFLYFALFITFVSYLFHYCKDCQHFARKEWYVFICSFF